MGFLNNKFYLTLNLLCLLFFLGSCSINKNREFVYKAYVINLEKSKNRMKIAQDQLSKQNIAFERFNAVDGYKIEITDIESGEKFTGQDIKDKKQKLIRWHKYFIDCKGDPKTNFTYLRTKKYMLTPGEFGCMCSHRAVLLNAIKEKLDYVIVFEDDISIISSDFVFLLHSAINQLPKNSIAFLDAHGPDVKHIIRNQKAKQLYFRLNGPEIYGNYALVYDIAAAKKVFNIKEEIMPIDNRIGEMIRDKTIYGYLLNKKSITYDHLLGSHIKEMGRPH